MEEQSLIKLTAVHINGLIIQMKVDPRSYMQLRKEA